MSAPIFYRAPSHMRYGRESYFKPKFVSIGPLYYKKIKKQKDIEEAKNGCISYFVSSTSNPKANINDLVRMIDIDDIMKDQIRRWYGMSFPLGDDEFFKMLVRDSCFIILIILDFSREGDDSMFYPEVDIKTVRFDLLLLENQIPFFFLRKVYNFLKENNMLPPAQSSEISTSNFPSNSPSSSPQGSTCLRCLPIPAQSHISQSSTQTLNQRQNHSPLSPGLSQEQSQSSRHLLQSTPQQSQNHTPQSTPEQTTICIDEFLKELKPFIWLDMPWQFYDHADLTEPKHLLDLYWKWCTPTPSNGQSDLSSRPSNDQGINLPNQCNLQNHCRHFPHDNRYRNLQNYDNDVARCWEKIHLRSNAPKRIKNADVLYQRAGVTFQKREHSKGFGVTFQNGILQIPHLQLDPKQANLLTNLVAFEELLNKPSKERLLTSYVLLLDGLINTEKDVELLQRHGVMTNKLGSSQMASTYFNDIGNVCTVDYKDHYCQKQFDDLNSYYNFKWNRRCAKLRHEYFNSPWAVISLFAGVFLLSLAAIQTGYNIARYYRHP